MTIKWQRLPARLCFCLVLAMTASNATAADPYGDRAAAKRKAAEQLMRALQEENMVLMSAEVNSFQWTTRADLDDPRTSSGIEGGAANVIGGDIYVSHGFRFGDGVLLSRYDIGTDSWTHGGASLPDAAVSRSEMAGATVNGIHYAIGGRTPSDALEAFDTSTESWTTLAPMPGGSRGGMGAAVVDGLIYVIGGRTGSSPGTGTALDLNEVYDPLADSWDTLAPMPTAMMDNYAVVPWGTDIYVFGGATDGSTMSGLVQVYDTIADSWSTAASMPTPRMAAAAGVCGDGIAVFGGWDTENLNVTEIYYPDSDSWEAGPNMPVAVSELSVGHIWNDTHVFSVGSGIFGVSGMVVQSLRCSAPPPIPTLNRTNLAVMAAIIALFGMVFYRLGSRRQRV